jgi:hypothetical protein
LRQLVLQGRVRRLLLMTATPRHELELLPDLAVTEWPALPVSYKVRSLSYVPADDERHFLQALYSFLDSELLGDHVACVRAFVQSRAESSVFSLEPVLLRWQDELSTGCGGMRADADDEICETEERADELALSWRDVARAVNGIQHLLAVLDAVQTDAKLDVFLEEVRAIRGQNPGQDSLCVMTAYARTAIYVQSALAAAGWAAAAVTGDLPEIDRLDAIEGFRQRGGVLVVTYGSIFGVELPETRNVMVYDALAPAAMEQALGRFTRPGRREPLHVTVLQRQTSSSKETRDDRK